jgi:hypothetical protein
MEPRSCQPSQRSRDSSSRSLGLARSLSIERRRVRADCSGYSGKYITRFDSSGTSPHLAMSSMSSQAEHARPCRWHEASSGISLGLPFQEFSAGERLLGTL